MVHRGDGISLEAHLEHMAKVRPALDRGASEWALSEIRRLRSRLAWRHEQNEGDRDHIIRQDGNWTIGVTERADGTWSSVWMEAGRAAHSRRPAINVRELVGDEQSAPAEGKDG